MTTYRVVVIPGDGIGPEIVDATVRVLRAVETLDGGFGLDLEYHDAGAGAYATTGTNISRETLAACRGADAVLKGPVGLPDVRLPDGFDVLVMENFLGDILSDLGGGTIGGIGLCPSSNIGDDAAYFEPIHGSAPTLTGQDCANPIGQILTAAMLLDHIGQSSTSRRVQDAVREALANRSVQIGADGCPLGGTRDAAERIIERLS